MSFSLGKIQAFLRGEIASIDLKQELERVEQDCIYFALTKNNDNRTHAGKMLNVGRTTLIERLKKWESPKGSLKSVATLLPVSSEVPKTEVKQ